MAQISKDYKKVEDALPFIAEMKTEEEVKAFIEGDDRKGIQTAADERIKVIQTEAAAAEAEEEKSAEAKAEIVASPVDPEVVTGEHVIKALREKGHKI